jgi:UDP-N-acetylmuramyl pentapeptide phosphotransferase/UDP-N-acetylglucosamine-1-phosphate transferase
MTLGNTNINIPFITIFIFLIPVIIYLINKGLKLLDKDIEKHYKNHDINKLLSFDFKEKIAIYYIIIALIIALLALIFF